MSQERRMGNFVAWLLLRDTMSPLTPYRRIVDGSNDGGIDAIYTLMRIVLFTDHKAVEHPAAARDMSRRA